MYICKCKLGNEGCRISLNNFSWLDNERLLIHVEYIGNNGSVMTSWIYNLEGGERV
jgi:hypothetical protein